MCKSKADGERCFAHAFEDYGPNVERIKRDERIMRNGQSLTREEKDELRDLKERTDTLTQKEKNRASILERTKADNSKLTPIEAKFYASNIAKREQLEASLNAGAVVGGALRRKELSLVRGDVIERYMNSDPEAADRHPDKRALKKFLARREEDPDTPLTRAEAKLADSLYLADPKRYNRHHEMLGGDNRRRPLTEEKYREQVEAVRRYEFLNPVLAPAEQKNVFAAISRLRRDPAAFKQVLSAVFLQRKPPAEAFASLPKEHAAVIQSGNLTARGVTLAVAQDQRVALYGLLAEKGSSQPKLYANSTDREAMDAARKLIPKDKDELSAKRLAERQRDLAAWEDRIRNEMWASSTEEVVFATPLPQAPTAKAVPAKPTASVTKKTTATTTPSTKAPSPDVSQVTTTRTRSAGGSTHSDKQDQRKFARNGREFGPPTTPDADATPVGTPPTFSLDPPMGSVLRTAR